jgi:hypothetical protein
MNGPLVEEFEDSLRGTSDDSSLASDDHRALHELRMLEQDIDDGIAGNIVVSVQAKRGKMFVFAHKGRRFLGQEVEKACEILTAYGLF